MDNIKTKMQTQSTVSCWDKLNKDCHKTPGGSINLKDKVSQSQVFFSTNPKTDCTAGETSIKYRDIMSTAKIIYRESGFYNGFFRGVFPRILCNAPACAISWGTYEFMKHTLLKTSLLPNKSTA